jgi:ADP-ribosyl-[dinitrogen reductase] hydrolase
VDAKRISDWGADLVISALPIEDLNSRGARDLPIWLKDLSVPWLLLPIPDWQAPDADFDEAWKTHGPETAAILSGGGKVFVHCMAGLGRSGTVVARLLIDRGISVDQAIQAARTARPGAVEAKAQEDYLLKVWSGVKG